MIKKLLLLIAIIATSITYGQSSSVVISGVSHPTNIGTVTAGSTFDVAFNYTSTEDIVLSVHLEVVAWGTSSDSYAIPESVYTVALAANTGSAIAQTATLTFPITNPLVGNDNGSDSTWTLPEGDGVTESQLSNTANANAGFRIKFSTDNEDDTITGLNTVWPWAGSQHFQFSDIDLTAINGVAAAPFIDLASWDYADPLTSGSSIDVQFMYSSDVDIPIGDITISLWETIKEAPWSQKWIIGGSNLSVLPSGNDLTAVIAVNVLAGETPTDANYVSNGAIISTDDLITAMPLGNANTGYQLRFAVKAGSDFSPTIAHSRFTLLEAPTASLDKFLTSDLTVFPNPTSGIVNISDVSNVNLITISNVNGQIVKTFGAQNSIDISDLTVGIYILKTDNGLIRKIIKE